MKEIKIEVFGRVQGVGFRHFAKEQADKLSLSGYVKNRSDGVVLIIAQGEKEQLEVFLHNVQKGPRLSKVDGVSYFWRDSDVKNKDIKKNGFVIVFEKGIVEDQARSLLNLGKRVLNIKSSIPRHIAIIPDGNRRWAKEKGLGISEGHRKAASKENIIALLDEARNLGVKYLTFWVFSTENWNRDSKELKGLFGVILRSLKVLRDDALKNKVRFRHLGRKDRLSKNLVKFIEKLEKDTEKFDEFNFQMCLDYGGRDEITRAMNKMLKAGVQEITEDDIGMYLDSYGVPDPDLIIRTSGEKRMSGFMSFQSAYAEFYFTDLHFPDFGPKELRKAVEEFGRRRRTFGGG